MRNNLRPQGPARRSRSFNSVQLVQPSDLVASLNVAPFDAMLLAFIEDCIRSDASANLCKTVTDSFTTKDFVRPARSTS